MSIEIVWCPAHSGVAGNEKADKWAKQAADEPDARGAEWMGHSDKYGRRRMNLPRSLTNIKREISEKKWEESRKWAEERIKGKKYRMSETQQRNRAVAKSPKRLTGRFHQLRTGRGGWRGNWGEYVSGSEAISFSVSFFSFPPLSILSYFLSCRFGSLFLLSVFKKKKLRVLGKARRGQGELPLAAGGLIRGRGGR